VAVPATPAASRPHARRDQPAAAHVEPQRERVEFPARREQLEQRRAPQAAPQAASPAVNGATVNERQQRGGGGEGRAR
jgi:hypothetical protein